MSSKRFGGSLSSIGGKNRAEHWLSFANDVLRKLPDYVPLALFPKPDELPSFLAIREAQDKMRGSSKPSQKRAELMRAYNPWHEHVCNVEGGNAGLLAAILAAYCVFSWKRDAQSAQTIRRHVEEQWLGPGEQWIEPECATRPAELDQPREKGKRRRGGMQGVLFSVHTRNELDKLSKLLCRDEETMPTWLKDGTDIPDSAYENEGRFPDEDFSDDDFDDSRGGAPSSMGSFDFGFGPGDSHD